jgi:hypothetical protein
MTDRCTASRGDSCRYPKTICFARCTTTLSTRQHLIYYTEPSVESWLNCVAAIDCDISVQDFPQDLGIGNKTLTVGDQFFEQTVRVSFVRMRCTDQIHRDI